MLLTHHLRSKQDSKKLLNTQTAMLPYTCCNHVTTQRDDCSRELQSSNRKKPTKQKHPMNSYLKDLDASRLLEN
jgi:hypothetical protein